MPVLVQGLKRHFDVTQARTADEITAAVREIGYDLVLLDLMMPELDSIPAAETRDGYEAGAYLYETLVRPALPNVPVVILTAVDTSTRLYMDAKERVARHGQFKGVIEKPVGPEDIVSFLRKHRILEF